MASNRSSLKPAVQPLRYLNSLFHKNALNRLVEGWMLGGLELAQYMVHNKASEVTCPEVSIQDILSANQREFVPSVQVRGQRKLCSLGLQSL